MRWYEYVFGVFWLIGQILLMPVRWLLIVIGGWLDGMRSGD
jgi:hypothetical protein